MYIIGRYDYACKRDKGQLRLSPKTKPSEDVDQ